MHRLGDREGEAITRRSYGCGPVIRAPRGPFERIATVLREREDRTAFVREAVEREIERRQAKRKPGKRGSR